MKLTSVILLAGLLVTSTGWTQNTNSTWTNTPTIYRPTVNRYQLFAATVEVNHESVPRLFRVDTVTGDVWRYNSAQLPVMLLTNVVNGEIESWVYIPEDNSFDQWTRAISNSYRMFSPASNTNQPTK